MEVDLQLVEQQTGQRAQAQAEYDLHQRFQKDADGVDAALLQRVCDAERGREEHQTHGIINGDHHQQQAGQGTACLVLLDHHQGGGRGCGRGDGTRRDGRCH